MKIIWKLPGMGQAKNFLWQLKSNILPTKVLLCKRKITSDSTWPICLQEDELTIYILWNCLASGDVWAEAKLDTQKWPHTSLNYGT